MKSQQNHSRQAAIWFVTFYSIGSELLASGVGPEALIKIATLFTVLLLFALRERKDFLSFAGAVLAATPIAIGLRRLGTQIGWGFWPLLLGHFLIGFLLFNFIERHLVERARSSHTT